MTDYVIRIVVEGQDKASGPLGGVSSALGNMGQIAGGILSAQLISGIANGVWDMGKAALDSYANYERLGMALQSMVAKEMANASVVETSTASTRKASQAELDRAAWLEKSIAAAQKSAAATEAGSDANLSAAKKVASLTAQLQALGISSDGTVTSMTTTSTQTMTLQDAMGAAGVKAKELQGWITQLAIKSPFNQDDIAKAFRLSMAYGFTTKEAKDLTTTMVDFAAGSGATGETMQRIALALGQIKAKGNLAGGEVRQLVEAGLGVDQILAKAMHKTTAEVVKLREAGLIPADDAIKMITDSLNRDFGGAAARQSETFSGLISSLEDIKSVGLRELFSGVFETAQPYIASFVNTLSSPEFMASLRETGNIIGGALKTGIEFLATVGPKAAEFFKGFVSPEMSAGFTSVGESISGIWATFQGILPSIVAFGTTLWTSFQTATQSFLPGILGNISGFIDQIFIFFMNNGQAIMNIVTTAWNFIVATIGGAITIISGVVNAGMQFINGIIIALNQMAQGNFQGAWDTIKSMLSGIWETIKTTAGTFIQGVLDVFGLKLTDLTTTWTNIWNNLPLVAGQVWDGLVATVNGWVSAAKNWFSGIDLGNIGKNIIDGLLGGLKSAWDAVTGWLGDAIRGLQGQASGAVEAHSPSKVYYRLGENMMQGLALGIRDAAGIPADAIASATAGLSRPGAGGQVVNQKSYTLNLSTMTSPNVVQSSFDILRVLEYGA